MSIAGDFIAWLRKRDKMLPPSARADTVASCHAMLSSDNDVTVIWPGTYCREL